ncbi:hypothetical protein [Pseudomonas purpurea]|uniref:hypothetical protein n=1 Tax=Pseudomonas purpurea TaxID=3136737 RepID=UPI0032668874
MATQEQVNTGTDDTVAVTPKKMKAGFTLFNSSSGRVGYLAFPSWLGSFVIQWGEVGNSLADVYTTLPVSFNSNFITVIVCNGYTVDSGKIGCVAASPYGLGAFVSRGSSEHLGANFIALGR